MPVRVFVTKGTAADCKHAARLIEGLDAEALLADRGYDTDSIIAQASVAGMEVVIPPKKTVKNSANMTNIYTNCATWSKMLFFISSVGAASPQDTPKTLRRFLLPFTSVAW